MSRIRPLLVCLGAALLLAAVLPQLALAVRYVKPKGATTGSCPESEPCRIDRGIDKAPEGEEVVILPGNYSIGGIEEIRTTKALNIHGPSPAEPPHIATSTDIGEMLTLGAGTRLADLEIEEKTNSYFGCAELGPGSTIERVRVVSTGQSGIITHEATVRDSIFVDSAESGAALFLVGPGTSVVRNVTSLATGDFGFALAVSTTNSVEAAAAVGNSILFSGSTGTDVSLQAEESGSKARAVLDHSNFDPETIRTYGKGMDTKTLGAGNQDSQTTPPQLVDLAAGDAHETAGSPTIDAGLSSPDLGTLDFEGDARVMGSAPDIGADEYPSSAPPPPPPGVGRPKISGLKLKRKAFRVKGGPKKKRGTAFAFTLDQVADVTITVRRVVKRKRKTAFRKVGQLTARGSAGSDTIAFSGRFGHTALPPGSYRADLVAAGPGGSSDPVSVRFRVLTP